MRKVKNISNTFKFSKTVVIFLYLYKIIKTTYLTTQNFQRICTLVKNMSFIGKFVRNIFCKKIYSFMIYGLAIIKILETIYTEKYFNLNPFSKQAVILYFLLRFFQFTIFFLVSNNV